MNKHTHSFKVSSAEIDSLNHVNNEVYLRWLMEAANGHSSALGYTMEKYLADGACFVVRRHEIDYLAPAFLDQDIIVETWIKEINGTKAIRSFEIKRNKDQKVLVKAETLFVYIDLTSNKPKEVPEEIKRILFG